MKKLILFIHQLFCHHKYKYTEINHNGINTIECKYCGKKKIVKINNMTQYIDKDALVEKVKERIETYNKGYANGDDKRANALEILLHDLDTLEVKEVDLKKELELWMKSNADYTGHFNILEFAKYFFELGFKINQKGK